MFNFLESIIERPAAFSAHTTADLWTDPHVSRQMLAHHLDGAVAVASHTTEFIADAVAWMIDTFGLRSGSRTLDLGCGPGLYTHRLAQAGIDVTGIDFSAGSIDHARRAAAQDGLAIGYVEADYLAWDSDIRFNLVTMIMRDYCALSPDRRVALLRKIERWLAPDGAFLFDVDSTVALESASESTAYSRFPSGGFWSPDPYFEFVDRFVYPEQAATLDKYVVIEADRTREIYNWIQYFTPESLAVELEQAGLRIESLQGDVTGRAFDPGSAQFAVVARRR